jgi:chromosome segregation ATPase
MSSAEIRALNRQLSVLQSAVNAIPTNPESASAYATAQSVVELEEKVLDLENKYGACKKFLEDALEKIGLLEKKLLDVESKQGCLCAKLDKYTSVSDASSEDDVKTTTVSENPVFDPSVTMEPLEEVKEIEEDEDDA